MVGGPLSRSTSGKTLAHMILKMLVFWSSNSGSFEQCGIIGYGWKQPMCGSKCLPGDTDCCKDPAMKELNCLHLDLELLTLERSCVKLW